MAISFRKSISAGPYRFNLSKSGLGLSVGVKGLRIGRGPKGNYVSAGIAGFQYKTSLNAAGEKLTQIHKQQSPDEYVTPDGVIMQEIESAEVMQMQPSNLSSILQELNERNGKLSAIWPLIAITAVTVFTTYELFREYFVISIVGIVPALMIGKWIDSYSRSTVIFYDLDDAHVDAYSGLVKVIESLQKAKKVWHIASQGQINSWDTSKHHGGASGLVDRKTIEISFGLPSNLKTNFLPPVINVGKQNLYFFPDMILVEEAKFGAVNMKHLHVSRAASRFIEDGRVPADAKIIGETWQHPNRDGGPDRRFANNRLIPICEYDRLTFKSADGINEAIEFSKADASDLFVRYMRAYQKFLRQSRS